MSEDRKNVYSEDQLDLARQLKAEFQSGNKKSKKDKKKRQSLSRTSTQDDPVFDRPAKDLQSIEPETIEGVTARDPIETTRDALMQATRKTNYPLHANFKLNSCLARKIEERQETEKYISNSNSRTRTADRLLWKHGSTFS